MPLKNFLRISLTSGLLSCSLPAQAPSDEAPAIPAIVAQKALQWMQHPDAKKREAAYRTFQLYGDEGGAIYRRTLTQARRLHQKKMSRLLENDRSNPFAGLPMLCETLDQERKRIYDLIKTDFKKAPDQVAMLRREVDSLAGLNEKVRRVATSDGESLEEAIETTAQALAEVLREIHLIEGDKERAEEIDQKTALEDFFAGATYLETKEKVAQIRAEQSALEAATADNEACDWAGDKQIDFTRQLNEARSLFGLRPLRLDEQLSLAATDHSKDMASLGFFAHQSPVPGKKSSADRARRAGFKHRCSGENIFVGSSSPAAAYQAWFASDGHRFIMFAQNPNLIGVGPHGKHWTMMTGSK